MLMIVLQFILGLLIGSFLNVVIYRLPIMLVNAEVDADIDTSGSAEHGGNLTSTGESKEGEQSTFFNLCWPPSHCPSCRQRLRWRHNIPLISFLLLKGRCYFCKHPISLRYPLVELATGVLTAAIFIHHQLVGADALWLSAAYLFAWLLIAITAIDWQTQLIPDELSLLLLWGGLFFNGVYELLVTPSAAIIGAMAGYLTLWLLALAYRTLRKREGIGYGDFKLLAALGAWFGALDLPMILLMASMTALITILIKYLLFRRFDWLQRLPFGPFLALAGMVRLLLIGFLMR